MDEVGSEGFVANSASDKSPSSGSRPTGSVAVVNRPSRTKELVDQVIKTSRDTKNKNARTSTLARLRLGDMRLHGRDNDMKLLKAKLCGLRGDQDANVENRPELILIRGVSGTGKTAVVMRGLQEPAQKMGVAFAGGKFDLNKGALPLSAFKDAMSSLTNFVTAHKDSKKITDSIRDAFGEDDIMLLANAFPDCEDLFSGKVGEIKSAELSANVIVGSRKFEKRRSFDGEGKESIHQLQYAMRRLFKAICTNLKGVVLFIDDLQWSDVATLGLIKSLSLDPGIPCLLLVGAYREDEVPESHPLALHIKDTERLGIIITNINVGNLDTGSVKSLIAEALGMEGNEDAVKNLATTVHKKTGGNAFFVLVFLRSLYDNGLLKYNFGVMKWLWDDEEINTKFVTQNVATLMKNKLQRFEKEAQYILKVASCLGASFSVSMVAIVVSELSDAAETASLDSTCIGIFEEEGILEISDDICRFSHDQVQQAAFELIPTEERDLFCGKIGAILVEKLDPVALERCLFVAVGLRNRAISYISSAEERKALAEMNLRTGIKASENAAFDTAAVYFEAGRNLLGKEGWESDKKIMLKLCSEGASVCFINGDLDTMNCLIDLVKNNGDSIREKFRAVEIEITALQSVSKFHESITVALDFTRQLGLGSGLSNKPVSKLTVINELIKTKRLIKNFTAEDIALLPELEDDNIAMGLRVFNLIGDATFQSQPTLWPLIPFLVVRLSIKHGVNAYSFYGFICMALIFISSGQPKRALEMAKAVELLINRFGAKRLKSRSMFILHYFVKHWIAPLQASLVPLLEGYQLGLETGDTVCAGMNIMARSAFLFYAGSPLEGLQHEMETGISVCAQMNQETRCNEMRCYLLAVKRLRGTLRDEDMEFGDLEKVALETNCVTLEAYIVLFQLELLVIFQDWEGAMSFLLRTDNLVPCLNSMLQQVRFTFLEALLCLKLTQATKSWLEKVKLKKKYHKSMKNMRGWLKKGNVNVLHCMHLLEAELSALKGKQKEAEGNFKSAATVAARNGFVQDRAMTHELASKYYESRGDEYWASYNMDCARRSYSDWGASAKLEHLNGK